MTKIKEIKEVKDTRVSVTSSIVAVPPAPVQKRRHVKPYEDYTESEIANINANRICDTIFCVGELVKRTKVYKKREKFLRNKMIEMMLNGSNIDAFAYATGVFIEKKRLARTLELASRVVDFTNFIKYNMDDMDSILFYSLEKISYLISKGNRIDLDRELKAIEDAQGYPRIDDGKRVKSDDIKITRKNVKAYMKKVRENPKIMSAVTLESWKQKQMAGDSGRRIEKVFKFKY